ncbi:hypothetical protein ORN01_21710 [Bacillus cereus]|uniref:3-oxoacyl-[acyl-carrier-protein] synthase III C-terminal domain-containing protein n=1 Tax=Bacillus TaxID=1386 RepID=UPI0005394CA8|nr:MULTISPECIES: 3-oxoacyl-[acyl-carrier-protein] synthase III C-terminal domain-containing protein [Bacillus]KIQ78529.1 hypothetical protein RW25_27760 [Bacillus sp. L_1B0_8]KIQ78642.1 hypothetical protein RT27_29390 [Bacillus sp. L_1B0_5]MDA1913552.1 hypothetical protein [Bacillus cereus]MDA2659672.1 hypothetical protein [Bacillus cereus]MDZ4631588.1 hypothetical protein [Bacillus cereus]
MSHISSYIPKKKVNVESVAKMIRNINISFEEEDVTRFKEDLGFQFVPIEDSLSLEEMLYNACKPTVEQLKKKNKPIDYIVFVKTSQVFWHEQNVFRRLIHDFNLIEARTFSVGQQNCASIHTALLLIKNLMSRNTNIRGVLLVTGDKAFHPSLRRIPDSLLGDSAVCCYLSKEMKKGSHCIHVVQNDVDAVTYNGVNSTTEQLAWFNTTYYFAIRQLIRKVLKEAQLELDQVSIIVGSNANYLTWVKVSEVLNCSIDKFYISTISEVGHLYCGDILYNIGNMDKEKIIKTGDYYLTLTVGLGGTYGCALHQYV